MSAALIFDKFPGVSPLISYLPVPSKKFRFVAFAIALCMLWFFAAEILIRGIDAMRASSLTVLPTLRLN